MARYIRPNALGGAVTVQNAPELLEVFREHGIDPENKKQAYSIIDQTASMHKMECRNTGKLKYYPEARCPCGQTIFISCEKCGEGLFMFAAPGSWCRHAKAAAEPGPVWWWRERP